jgi:CMP-N-acetylneuraminic acid synthetase
MRHHSERVPGKNYREFAGRPLYFHIVRTLLGCPSIEEVVIDTDSPRIRAEAPQHFERVRVVERPEHLRAGHIPMNDVLLHDVAQVAADFYLQSHSTNPLLRSETIERAISAFMSAREHHDSLFGVTRRQVRLYDAEGVALNHDPDKLLRTQDLPPVYEENSCLYLFDARTLRETGNRIGRWPLRFEIPQDEAWDIDEESDFAIAECLYSRREGVL